MTITKVLKEQIDKVRPEEALAKELEKNSKAFVAELRKDLREKGHDAQVFIGGSVAKGTLIKKDSYDADIFVRFDWKYDNISDILQEVLQRTTARLGLKLERLHGSRDYFKCHLEGKEYYYEVIPVTKIKKVHQERNVTDLSYFHVSYIRRKIKGLEDQVRLAKTFMQAQRVAGAESYIRGFSGYAVECLIVYYKSFLKMLQALSKVDAKDRLVIDIEKYYKKQEVFFEMNENRLHSPVIIVDPTYKERNALAALSRETFERFQDAARKFLKKPSGKFFEHKPIDGEKLHALAKRKKQEYVEVMLTTDRQAGDIAGTKLRKFADFIVEEVGKYYSVGIKEFEYSQEQSATLYVSGKSKKKIVRIGPPVDGSKRMKHHAKEFKAEHPKAYEKNKYLHADIKIDFTLKEFFENFAKDNKEKLKEMGITELRVS